MLLHFKASQGVILKQPNDLKHRLRPAYDDSLAQLWSARRKFGNKRSNVQLSRPSEGGDLRQQLLALSAGEKLKLTVDQTSKDSGATFKSDDLAGASISASRQHAMGT